MVLLNYHKSIACLPHQPDFVMIHHVIYGATFFKQGHSSKNLEWVLAGVAGVGVGRGRSDKYYRDRAICFHVFSFPFFLVDQLFVLLFVLRQYLMLLFNTRKPKQFISFFDLLFYIDLR